jgi:CRP/FNR family transcriptional regulator
MVVPPGIALFWAGAPCKANFVVRADSLLSYVSSRSGSSQIVTFHLPGEIVGSGIPGARVQRNCTSVALESTRGSAIPYAVWREAIDCCPACRDQFMQKIRAQAMHLETHLQVLGRPIALQRWRCFSWKHRSASALCNAIPCC